LSLFYAQNVTGELVASSRRCSFRPLSAIPTWPRGLRNLPIGPRGCKQTADALDERLRCHGLTDGKMKKTSTFMLGGVVAYAQVARAPTPEVCIAIPTCARPCVCLHVFIPRVILNDTLCAGPQADTMRLSILVNA
jgi:hypothetical protein